MFNEIIDDAVSGTKALIGRVLAMLLAAAVIFLAGLGISVPGYEPVEPTPTVIVEPTVTDEPTSTIVPTVEITSTKVISD